MLLATKVQIINIKDRYQIQLYKEMCNLVGTTGTSNYKPLINI